MSSQTSTNSVTAITPEIWSDILQVPLYKSLVAMEVANVQFRDALRVGDVINKQYFTSLTSVAYVQGTPFALDDLAFATDQLTVDNYRIVAFYVDDIEQLRANIDIQRSLLEEAAYQLKDYIDQQVFYNISAGIKADDADLLGGTASALCTAGTATIINLFANARKMLRDNNVEEAGDWCAVVTPKVANMIETKATSVGYNVADSTLRNGYLGDFMGFQIYVSNNLPTETTASASATRGISTSGVVRDTYIGRKRQIELLLQQAPKVEIKDVPDKLGKNIVVWTVFGDTVYTKGKSRFLDAMLWDSAGA